MPAFAALAPPLGRVLPAGAHGSLPRPRIDQRPGRPAPGLLPAPLGQTITAQRVIVRGANGGVFVYNGPGTLAYSIAAMAGTDLFGNAYLNGATSYIQLSPGHWWAVQHSPNTNGITWYTASTPAGPWTEINQVTANGIDGAIVVQKSFSLQGGAANPSSENWYAASGDATGNTDTAFILAYLNSFGGAPGLLHLLPSSPAKPYFIKANQIVGTTGQYIVAPCAYIKAVSAGDIFRWVDATTYAARNPQGGGGVLGFPLVDGGAAGAGSIAFHGGDILQLRYEIMAQNFTGAGSWGALLDNQNFFTEQSYGRTWTKNCQNHVGYQFGGSGTNSFARANSWHFIAQGDPRFNGVVLGAGANVYDTLDFQISGNFTGGSTGPPGAVLTLGANSQLQGKLDIGVELGAGAVVPQTLNFGTGSIIKARGGMRFTGSAFGTSNIVAAGVQFRYTGTIEGDFTLVPTDYHGTNSQGAIVTGGTIFPNEGGNVSLNPAGAVTGIIIAAGAVDGQELIIENVSGNLITFAAAATSNVAGGAGATVPGLTNRLFVWKSSTALWYGGL